MARAGTTGAGAGWGMTASPTTGPASSPTRAAAPWGRGVSYGRLFRIKADGGRCGAQAIKGSDWCFNHHPDYEERRRRRASRGGRRGGRGRPVVELADIKDRLRAMVEHWREGRMDRGDAAVCGGQLYNSLIRAVSVELRAREQQEVEERLAELERLLESKRDGGNRWGA